MHVSGLALNISICIWSRYFVLYGNQKYTALFTQVRNESLIPFLALILRLIISEASTLFNSSSPKLISRHAGVSKLDFSLHLTTPHHFYCSSDLLWPFKTLCTDSTENTVFYCYGTLFTDPLPNNIRPSVVRVRLAGMCLPSCCLAMSIHVTVLKSIGSKVESWGTPDFMTQGEETV
jgi:hypothetical protein